MVKPSYSFWAPWIGPKGRISCMAYNTEHRKCHCTSPKDLGADTNDKSDDEQIALQTTPSEEDLVEMMHFAQVAQSNMYTSIISSEDRWS